MPRKTRTGSEGAYRPAPAPRPVLLGTLRGLEEGRELGQLLVAEGGEARHRRARVDAARALQVVDLELDSLVLGALGAQVGRAEVRAPGAEVGVAAHTPRLGEELGAGDRGGVVREALLL